MENPTGGSPAKTKQVLLAVVIILLVGILAYRMLTRPKNSQGPVAQPGNRTPKTSEPVVVPSVSDKLPETNPFKVDVNPYGAYKNPFSTSTK